MASLFDFHKMVTKFATFCEKRFLGELLLQRGSKRQEYLVDCVPNERSVILLLLLVMSMLQLQVRFHILVDIMCFTCCFRLLGVFTTNMVAAAPVLYCKNALDISKTARAVLINAGQANAATGDAGYQDVLESAGALAMVHSLRVDISISRKSCFN
ncbi:hypothetical protein SADUNF_Sadunf12G0089800 [Salix dunnii]|uniref:Uncharacterized protein n=1 Tax=Salix dunnii TaxID=1413687 RepID=A0A835JRS2_9ROSI|nr:hypothetical protein SADUNF_Sadunf12G0089800 [Salix dunnii]